MVGRFQWCGEASSDVIGTCAVVRRSIQEEMEGKDLVVSEGRSCVMEVGTSVDLRPVPTIGFEVVWGCGQLAEKAQKVGFMVL